MRIELGLLKCAFFSGALAATACGDEIECTGGARRENGQCKCPTGQSRLDGECVDLTDSGRSIDPTTAPDARTEGARDAGASDVDEPGGPLDSSAHSEAAPDAHVVDSGRASVEGVGGVDAGPSCVPTTEVCNGKDDDCDVLVDEDVSEAPLGTACSNGGQGICSKLGKQACLNGVARCDAPPPMPSAEICDGIDNDCNGEVDDGPAFAAKGTTCTAGTGDCQGTGIHECDPADPSKLRCSAVAKLKTCGDSCTPLSTEGCTAGSGDCLGTGVFVCDAATGAPRCTAVAKPKNACGVSCGPVPAESCSTAVDDNCNGTANEGCCVATVEICGDGKDNDCNGTVDDGKNECGLACGTACPTPRCGDGIKNQSSEQCDDANASEDDGCMSDCTFPPYSRCGGGQDAECRRGYSCDLDFSLRTCVPACADPGGPSDCATPAAPSSGGGPLPTVCGKDLDGSGNHCAILCPTGIGCPDGMRCLNFTFCGWD
jgi:Putative metal-binding motif